MVKIVNTYSILAPLREERPARTVRAWVGVRRKLSKNIRCRKGGISDPVSTGMLFKKRRYV
jgi:hypothetical protein